MKTLYLSLAILIVSIVKQTDGLSQTLLKGLPTIPLNTSAVDAAEKDLIDAAVNQIDQAKLQRREKGLEFYNDMLLFSEPTEASGGTITDFMKVVRGVQRRPYVLHADVKTPIAIGGKFWGYNSLHVIPRFQVRIFQDQASVGDNSLPVRTPSYMPGAIYYTSNKRLWEKGWFGSASYFHHSNGQDQPEFVNGRVNTYNGNFSTNYFTISIHKNTHSNRVVSVTGKAVENFLSSIYRATKCLKKDPNRKYVAPEESNSKFKAYWKLGLEWHPPFLTNDSFKMYNLYGRHRLNFQYSYIHLPSYIEYLLSADSKSYIQVARPQTKEMFRLIFDATYILDPRYNTGNINQLEAVKIGDVSRRLNASLSMHYRIPGSQYTSLFLKTGYWGSDPYNMYFQQSAWFLRVGLGMGFFGYSKDKDFQ